MNEEYKFSKEMKRELGKIETKVLLDSVQEKLTSDEWIAFSIEWWNLGIQAANEGIIEFLESKRCFCINGYPESQRVYYKTSGNQTRESLYAEQEFYSNHQYCDMLSYKRTLEFIKGENK